MAAILGPFAAMSPNAQKTFIATLEHLRSNLGWTIARVLFDADKAWPEPKS